jgi:membrane-bound lytic murein transglycosylase B
LLTPDAGESLQRKEGCRRMDGMRKSRVPWPAMALAAALAASAAAPAKAAADPAFRQWLEGLWPQAQSMGISRKTFDAATAGVEPDLTLPDLDLPSRGGAPPRGQAEFVQTPADYIKEANIARLAERARKLAAEHGNTLAAIEQKFGVPGNVLVAITAGARTCSSRSCSTPSRCWRRATPSSPT